MKESQQKKKSTPVIPKFPSQQIDHLLIQNKMWRIPSPKKYHKGQLLPDPPILPFSGWYQPLFFEKIQPIYIEYCSGNGAWIAAKAKEMPHINFVAVEMKWSRACKTWKKIYSNDLDNLLVINAEGLYATKYYFPTNSIDEVYINFPDPWPKRRHANFRLINKQFTIEMMRILKTGGFITTVTDDVDYSKTMIEELKNFKTIDNGMLLSKFPDPYFITEWEGYGTSYFEELWREKQKIIHYHRFKKVQALTVEHEIV